MSVESINETARSLGFNVHDIGKWPRPKSWLSRAIGGLSLGPGVTAVDYHKMALDTDSTDVLPRLRGASSIYASPGSMRTWDSVALVGVKKQAFEGLKLAMGDEGEEAREAVVSLNRNGDVMAGLLPEGSTLGSFRVLYGGDSYKTIFFLTGPSVATRVAGPALVSTSAGRLYIPRTVEVLHPDVPLPHAVTWPGQTSVPIPIV